MDAGRKPPKLLLRHWTRLIAPHPRRATAECRLQSVVALGRSCGRYLDNASTHHLRAASCPKLPQIARPSCTCARHSLLTVRLSHHRPTRSRRASMQPLPPSGHLALPSPPTDDARPRGFPPARGAHAHTQRGPTKNPALLFRGHRSLASAARLFCASSPAIHPSLSRGVESALRACWVGVLRRVRHGGPAVTRHGSFFWQHGRGVCSSGPAVGARGRDKQTVFLSAISASWSQQQQQQQQTGRHAHSPFCCPLGPIAC